MENPRAGRRPSGRRAQAARNDELILAAARTVFLHDPAAPIAAVAKEAGVGISALYHRYAGKEDLVRRLCGDGLAEFVAVAEDRLARGGDAWDVFVSFVEGVIEADVHALTVNLAGTFTPSEELGALARRAQALGGRIFDGAAEAGALRPGLVLEDMTLLFDQVTAIKVADPERTRVLRRRHLAIALDGWRAGDRGSLPGPGPTGEETGERWVVTS